MEIGVPNQFVLYLPRAESMYYANCDWVINLESTGDISVDVITQGEEG